MNTVSLTFHGKPHQLRAPSSWNEVTPFQLKAWILSLMDTMPESEKLKLAVPIFYSIPPELYKAMAEHYRVQLAPYIRFIFQENKLNKWLIPSVKVGFKTYHGPADKLSNVTAYEFFAFCERLYWKYKGKPTADNLSALIAVLYREKRTGLIDNDIRCQLTDAGVSKRVKAMANVPAHTRIAILLNYEGCRNFITALHPKVFSGGGGQSKKRGDVTLSVAGGPLGDLNQTRQSNLYDFLLHLEQMIEREEQLKEQTNG